MDRDEFFVNAVTTVQQDLFAYILTLVFNTTDANDVLQETNLVLWQKREEFQTDRDFGTWARGIARFQVMAYRKRLQRDRLQFNDTLVNQLADEADERFGQTTPEQVALEQCLAELTDRNAELLEMRYSSDLPASKIAERLCRSVGAIYDALYRIRIALASCIKRKMSAKEGL